jgi:phage-related protein
MPYCGASETVWEARSDLTDGEIARVIFSAVAVRMVLLYDFIKKTQQTPVRDLKLVLKCLKEVS